MTADVESLKNVQSLGDGYHGSVYGFGPSRGVLTWQNSD